jgi:glutamyl-tRNA reductase
MRERVAISTDEMPRALDRLGAETGNGVILSTCNRTEIYFLTDQSETAGQARGLFLDATGGSGRVEQHLYHLENEDAVRHLHRVACGMDSMIFGEVEILRQVRVAMTSSFESGYLTSILDRLFHSALRSARRLHAETYLGRYDRSVATAAVGLACSVLGDISHSKVLVLGAGDAGAMTIKAMLRHGAGEVSVANRTHARAVNLASHTGTTALQLKDVPHALRAVDLVVCASASPLVSRDALASILPDREGRPIVLVDIGMPRNIDPSIRDLPDVHLFDMDDLIAMCPAAPEDRDRDLALAETIFEEEVTRFLAWWRSSQAVPTITALEESVEEARLRELAKTLRRVPTLDDEQKQALDALTKAIVKKVLHQPITRLKLHGDNSSYIAVGRELFGLENSGFGDSAVTRNGAKPARRRAERAG